MSLVVGLVGRWTTNDDDGDEGGLLIWNWELNLIRMVGVCVIQLSSGYAAV